MCGLCGFGLGDAQLVLELDETKAQALEGDRALEDRFEQVTPAPMPRTNVKISKARADSSDADKRSLLALVARAVAILWAKHVGGSRPAHGL